MGLSMTKPITHRCPGSLAVGASVRFQKEMFDDKPRWWLMYVHYDVEFMKIYLDEIYPIEYCPFCGKELKNN